MAKRMVRAKVFRVGCAPSIEEIDASLEGLQTFVGGFIEGINLDPQHENHHILYCNEDGRAKGLPPNLQLPNGVVVVGDAVMVLHNSDGEAIPLITEREPEAIRMARRHLPEDGSEMKHIPTPWVVIYHSQGDIFDIKVVEDKMVADGLAEEADNKTEGNIETLSLPASKLFTVCNNHDALLHAAMHTAAFLLTDPEEVKSETLLKLIKAIMPCNKEAGERLRKLRDSALHKLSVFDEGKEPYEKPAIRAGAPPKEAI